MLTGESAKGLDCQLLLPDGTTSKVVVDADRASVGSGAHCEVRLPPELVPREIVVLELVGDQVRFRVTAPMPQCCVGGRFVQDGVLGPNEQLEIGGVSLRVAVVDLEKVKSRVPLELAAIIPLVFAVVVSSLWLKKQPDPRAPRPPPAPSLLSHAPPACHSLLPVEAGHLAKKTERVALAMGERGMFSPRDAVASVKTFETAAACYTIVNDGDSSRRMQKEADRQRKALEEEYQLRRTRLEHAASENDPNGVKRELRVLTPMTSHLTDGRYVEWLRELERWAAAAS